MVSRHHTIFCRWLALLHRSYNSRLKLLCVSQLAAFSKSRLGDGTWQRIREETAILAGMGSKRGWCWVWYMIAVASCTQHDRLLTPCFQCNPSVDIMRHCGLCWPACFQVGITM